MNILQSAEEEHKQKIEQDREKLKQAKKERRELLGRQNKQLEKIKNEDFNDERLWVVIDKKTQKLFVHRKSDKKLLLSLYFYVNESWDYDRDGVPNNCTMSYSIAVEIEYDYTSPISRINYKAKSNLTKIYSVSKKEVGMYLLENL